MKNNSKTVAFVGLCAALALILAYLEILIPPLFPAVPGIKMGLPNVVTVFLLYRRGALSAFSVSLTRILLSSLLFGNTMALMYSLAGGMLSLLVMLLLRRINLFSTVGVSVAGGVSHNVGQIGMAMWLLDTVQIGYYLAILTVTGIVAGICIGLCGSVLVKKIPNKLIF